MTEINCLAVEMRPDDSQINLNATFFRNSIPINIYYPPPRHLVLNSQENIIGILITPTLLEDSLAEYHCTVGDLTSLRSILYVGGRSVALGVARALRGRRDGRERGSLFV